MNEVADLSPMKKEEFMKGQKRMVFFAIGVAFMLMAGLFTGCATTGQPEKVGCDGNIEWDITPEAKITSFECALGTHGGEPALIFNAGIQNVTDQALRYRINIFLLDMDKAAGHYVPRKGKPPVVEPGKEEMVKIPFIKTDMMAKDMLVVVKILSIED
jgi:hypothetical protein